MQVMQLLSSGYRLPPPPGCPKTIYDIKIKCWYAENACITYILIGVEIPTKKWGGDT